MKDFGVLNYFLGLEVSNAPNGYSLTQGKYAYLKQPSTNLTEILRKAHILKVNRIINIEAMNSNKVDISKVNPKSRSHMSPMLIHPPHKYHLSCR